MKSEFECDFFNCTRPVLASTLACHRARPGSVLRTQPAFLSQPALMSRTLRPPNGRKKSPTKQDPVGQVLLSKIQLPKAAVQPSSWLGCAHTALHVHITANLTSCKVMLPSPFKGQRLLQETSSRRCIQSLPSQSVCDYAPLTHCIDKTYHSQL